LRLRTWLHGCRLAAHGVECKRVTLVGGGSKNALWRRVAADVFQRLLVFPVEAESAALGAALQAAAVHARTADVAHFVAENAPAMEDREVEPDKSARDTYAAGYQQHRALGEALFGDAGAAADL
jgi:xylulokinase